MNASFRALRAITAILFQRIFKPVAWIGVGILVVLFALVIYLGDWVHPAWFLLFIILIPLAFIATAIALALWYLSRRLLPRPLSSSERGILLSFADKILKIVEVRATPVPLLVAMIAKDVIRGRNSSYIEELVRDSSSLKSDFQTAKRMFETKTLS
jgi:hypothetical protein